MVAVDIGSVQKGVGGAGAAALATGPAQGAWMLCQLAVMVPGLAVTTRPGPWRHGDEQLLLAEAFITAAGKPEPLPAGHDAADAAAAGLALAEMLDGHHIGLKSPLPVAILPVSLLFAFERDTRILGFRIFLHPCTSREGRPERQGTGDSAEVSCMLIGAKCDEFHLAGP